MAIPISKLSELLTECPSAEEALAKLRREGLLAEQSSDAEILKVIHEGTKKSADEIDAYGFTWATADTRIAHLLSCGHLSQKGMEWVASDPGATVSGADNVAKQATGMRARWGRAVLIVMSSVSALLAAMGMKARTKNSIRKEKV